MVRRWVSLANLILIPALALLAVLGPALGRALYQEERVGDHLPLLALGVLFSCWQSLGAYVLNGVDRQKTSAAIALGADGVQLVLTCLTVGQWGMGGYAVSFVLASLVGAVLSWRAVAQATGLALPIFSWFTAPTLAACLAASCGDLMEIVLSPGGGGGSCPAPWGAWGLACCCTWRPSKPWGVWGGKPERPPVGELCFPLGWGILGETIQVGSPAGGCGGRYPSGGCLRSRLGAQRPVARPAPGGSPTFFEESRRKEHQGSALDPGFLWPLVPTRWFLWWLFLIRQRGNFLRYTKTDLGRIFEEKYAGKHFRERKFPNQGIDMGPGIVPQPPRCAPTSQKPSPRRGKVPQCAHWGG